MKLSFREEELAFEKDVVQFVDEHWPETIRSGRASLEFARRWFDALVAKGWSVPQWPTSMGGTDWTPTQKFIWERTVARAEAPTWDPCGTALAGPLLYSFGNHHQRERFLPGIRALQARWCHSFAARDPTRIEVLAVRRGERYFASGRVVEVVGASDSDYMMGLIRTDPSQRAEAGLSLCIVDLHGDGIAVEGMTVTLDEVVVADAELLGDESQGWNCAVAVLDHERTAVRRVTSVRVQLDKLKNLLSRTPDGNGLMLDQDEDLCRKVAAIDVQLMSLEGLELRVLSDLARGAVPGPEASVLQIKGGELAIQVGELIVESLGYYAMPYPDEHLLDNEGPIGPGYALPAIRGMLFGRSWSAYSGNPELERDRVAERILGPQKS